MPASATHDADDPAVQDQAPKAPVIDLASRRRPGPAAEPAPVETLEDGSLVAMFEDQSGGGAQEQASLISAAWEQAVADQGASLRDPQVAAGVRGAMLMMERLVYGGLTIRHGDETRGIEANPRDGIDDISGQMMIDLVRGLRDAADAYAPQQRERM